MGRLETQAVRKQVLESRTQHPTHIPLPSDRRDANYVLGEPTVNVLEATDLLSGCCRRQSTNWTQWISRTA